MPTIAREDGLRVQVNSRDERGHLPHAHVIGPGWDVRIKIGAAAECWSVAAGRPTNKDIQLAEDHVKRHLAATNRAWSDFNG